MSTRTGPASHPAARPANARLARFRTPSVRKWPFAIMKVPILDWLPAYTKEMFVSDLSAGLTVFVFLVPQGMAYALLAGLPTVYGLYSSIVPLILYAMLGTCRQLSMGPMALTSLLLGVSCQKYDYEEESPEYIQLAMNISMLVGLITYALGTFRMGTLSNLISPSVLVGFITASALVIAINQVKYMLGLDVPRFSYIHQTLYYLFTHLSDCNASAVIMGTLALLVLTAAKELKKRVRSPDPAARDLLSFAKRFFLATSNLTSFFCIVVGSLIAQSIEQSGGHIPIVGSVPSGFIAPGFSFLPFQTLMNLVPSSLAISFVAFAGNWAVARKYSAKHGYEVDATQELLSLGFANIVGVLFNSFVVSGGLGRSAVNEESGAVTQISGCVTAILILMALFLFTSLLYYIPMAVLGAVIEVSIFSMMEFPAMVEAYHKDRSDFLVMIVTFLSTLFIGVSTGLFIGMLLSIAVVMHSSAYPRIVHLGRMPLGGYKDVRRFPEAEQIPGVAIVRMDASLYFANCAHFKEVALAAARGEYHSSSTPIRLLVIESSAWVNADLATLHTLNEIREETQRFGVRMEIACVKGVLRDRLRAGGYVNGSGADSDLYLSVDDALASRPGVKNIALEVSRLDDVEETERELETQEMGSSRPSFRNGYSRLPVDVVVNPQHSK